MTNVVCIVMSQSTNFYLLDVENAPFVNIVDIQCMAHFPNSSEGLSLWKIICLVTTDWQNSKNLFIRFKA